VAASPTGPPIGVLLFNLGGPGTLDDVEPFLINLFSDRDIIELPLGAVLQPIVARIIAKSRGPSVRENYRRIGGGSPQLRLTREQARAIQDRLNRNGVPARTFIAMRYWQPTTEQALEAMAAEGVERVVTLTLFPHYSQATTGSSEKELRRVLAMPRWRGRFDVSGIRSYADDPLYLDAMTDTARRALDGFPADVRDRVVLLFSAHGLPQKFIDRGDPYLEDTEKTRRGILARLSVPNRHVLGFQSRTGPVKWIGPGTEEILRELGREGVREVLLVPLSFVSDHIETLYEVDMLFADEARAAGIVDYRRPEALNTHPLFIESLATQVERHLRAAERETRPAGRSASRADGAPA
jgi:protoporphyrin/coproporphyrin ferrochelatase